MKRYVLILSVFLGVLLLSCCQNKSELSENALSASSQISSDSSSVSDSSHAEPPQIVEDVVMHNASLDFTEELGFKVTQWVLRERRETKIINNQIAEIPCPLEVSNLGYLRIAKQGTKNIIPTLDGTFDNISTLDVEGISVDMGYTIGGPMRAVWEKNGYIFCYYHKKGELTMEQERFPGWLRQIVHNISVDAVDPTAVIMDNASLDFTEVLGFKVTQWVVRELRETKIINNQIAEIMCELDLDNFGYLRIAKQGVKGIVPELGGTYDIYTIQVEGIPVDMGYTMGGPMQAVWEKDGYIFCYYHKKGGLSLAEEGFPNWLRYFVHDMSVVSQ